MNVFISYCAAILPWCWKWSPIQCFIGTFLRASSKTRSVCYRRNMIEWQLFTLVTELESLIWRFLLLVSVTPWCVNILYLFLLLHHERFLVCKNADSAVFQWFSWRPSKGPVDDPHKPWQCPLKAVALPGFWSRRSTACMLIKWGRNHNVNIIN